MTNENNSYRIRTEVGVNSPAVLNVKLNQTFEFLNILSLKIGQKNLYRMPAAPYGVICGRVLLGGKSFGIQNAKVSIFIPKDNTVFSVKDDILYAYSSVDSVNYDGIRYNLLPSYVDDACHQNVGTMFEKEYVLDNNDVIKIFDSYYTYTTTTNHAGDYFIYGVPVGHYTLHVDVDLSDIGPLSVRPHDMIGQGYNINEFESPNKFKADKNLNILPQIKSKDEPVDIYSFWGDTTENEDNVSITRADMEIDYKIEPSAVFMGSIITDKGSNSISHKCVAEDLSGKMSELITGEGRIEMIRKTFDGKVEQFSIKGNRLIDGDGVWCYQIPMNLDYVMMDEFGNIVPTDNPETGLPTRAQVRFRVSLDENPMDDSARKRARFLIPNNPRLTDDYPNFNSTHEADYEFGTFTKDESYRDLFWNNVYTVKSYIPRLQKRVKADIKKHTGIKMTNHAGDNNPMPYNNLQIKMGFVYRFLCVLLTAFLYIVSFINNILALLGIVFIIIGDVFNTIGQGLNFRLPIPGTNIRPMSWAAKWFFKLACTFYSIGKGMVITLDSDFCDDGGVSKSYILGFTVIINKYVSMVKRICGLCGEVDELSVGNIQCFEGEPTNDMDSILNCVQNELAQNNDVTSFDFYNDWVNGVLYAPLWFRKIKPKRKIFFGLIPVGGVDDWCDGNSTKMAGKGAFSRKGLKLYQNCAQQRNFDDDIKRSKLQPIEFDQPEPALVGYKDDTENNDNCYGYKCHKKALSLIRVDKGIVIRKETKYDEYVYYYKSVEYDANKLRNILKPYTDDGKINYGEVKLLFATDLVLLGSLNDCDINGIPQFFKHLGETTYNMPPSLMSLTWNVNEENINGFVGDNVNENIEAIDKSSVHTEFTGADWGNAGFDQWYDKDRAETSYTKNGGNEYDNGGLFYDINCNFSYVKPKSCINLSRVCEFGVSLDSSISFKNENNEEVVMPPDGFISYDEIYNMDARAIFTTLNGNSLRVKQSEKTGFPVYDFNYLYPENFDGSLSKLMEEVFDKLPPNGMNASDKEVYYRKNYNLEMNSDAYIRFRYGYDKDKFKVSYYDSEIKLGMFSGNKQVDGVLNLRRFPRYENSFYFYFGLKSGKTAIDKFRSNYYAECTNDATSKSSISIDYVPNTWCNDSVDNPTIRDGYISFDLSNVELPCSIIFNERNGGDTYDQTFTGIHKQKIYIGAVNTDLQDDGFIRLFVDDENKQIPERIPIDLNIYHAPTLKNGFYNITIVDADGVEYRQNISFESSKLSYDVLVTDFTLTNEELETRFPVNTWYSVASDNTLTSTGTNYKRDIGGYITVSSIVNDGQPMTDNFSIKIESVNEIEGYEGSLYKVVNGVITKEGVEPFSENDGEYVFGVPNGGVNYIVTVYQVCPLSPDIEISNNVRTRVLVSEPQPFKMFVNGIDTELLKKFTTGYIKDNNGVIYSPYTGYDENNGIDASLPWLNIQDVGVSELLSYPADEYHLKSWSDIVNQVNALSDTTSYIYNFTDEYLFEEKDVNKLLNTYDALPDINEMTEKPKYIRVKRNSFIEPYDPFDDTTWIFEYNQQGNSYSVKMVDNHEAEDITVQEYFEMGNFQAQCNVIDILNGIIQKRLNLINLMIEAFWMYSASEENKVVSITYQTRETPVNTLVYYIPDSNNTLSLYTGTNYKLLDVNKEENTITSFSKPTITKNNSFTKPIFYKINSNTYKLPPYCAIKNRMNVTVPKTLGTIPFGNNNNIVSVISQITGGMDNMFGFHVIDKRPFTKVNIWIPIINHPIYWPDVEETVDTDTPSSVESFIEGGFIDVNGCLSGYFYNGFSTSTSCVAQFINQKATNKVEMYTLTTVNNDGINPNEFAVPTKRLLYEKPYTEDYEYTYNDFIKENNPEEGFDSDSINTGGENTDKRYISYNTNTPYFIVSDEKSSFNEDLYASAKFGLSEDTVYGFGFNTQPSFSEIDEPIQYTTLNSPNPVYKKVYENNRYLLVNPATLNMTYNAALPVSSLIQPTDKRVYFIGYTSDGKYRGISPTYEIQKVDVGYTVTNNHPALRVEFEVEDVKDYYLRKYQYQFIIKYNQNIDGEVSEEESISQIITPTYDDLPITTVNSVDWKYTDYYVFNDINVNNIVDIISIYVKDITGIRRLINKHNR